MAVLIAYYRFVPPVNLVVLPVFILLAFAASLGAGLWIAALMVEYRDFKFIVPFIVQFGLYVSPVGFYSSVVPVKWRLVYSLNPIVGVIDGFRWCILGGQHQLYIPGLATSFVSIILLLISGIVYFRRTEKTFADVI
jgi:lipopolysaccharide transport system permease protein